MDLSLSFLAGLLGSMHCVGMCGAIVLAYSTQLFPGGEQGRAPGVGSAAIKGIPGHSLYNSGRILSYTLIGALAGFLGGAIGSIREVGAWVSIIGGVAVAGLLMLDLLPRINVWSPGEHTMLRKFHLKSITDLLSLRSLESKFYIGLLTPFLPCGLLYSMFIKAGSSGCAVDGAVTMLVFGLGIVPSLLITGVVSAYIGIKLRFYANRLAAMTIILMGVIMIMRGAGVPMPLIPGSHHDEMHHERHMHEQLQ